MALYFEKQVETPWVSLMAFNFACLRACLDCSHTLPCQLWWLLIPIAWEVTDKAVASVMDEDHTKWNARAKNALFDAISEEIFARVHSKKTAHEVWEELETIHVGYKKLREEKYQVLKEKLNAFKMLPSELVEQIC